MRLILGGLGTDQAEDTIRIDKIEAWADMVWDLEDGLPKFEEGQFDYIQAWSVLEHVQSVKAIVQIMRDAYKYLEVGGTLDIKVPHWKSESAVECIEHCHFYNENSFMNFYANPHAEVMGYPQYNLVSNEIEQVGPHQECHIILQK